ncbi:MAG: hypothetical protein HKM24_04680, partial [Gammaproteobacteria bacterium]|nr:hypothetical protein [Gammaproteobacteria bacterium]
YVNGKLIKKHALQNGDVVTIGHHQMRFVDQPGDAEQSEFEKTMIITPGSQQGAEDAINAAARKVGADQAAAMPAPAQVVTPAPTAAPAPAEHPALPSLEDPLLDDDSINDHLADEAPAAVVTPKVEPITPPPPAAPMSPAPTPAPAAQQQVQPQDFAKTIASDQVFGGMPRPPALPRAKLQVLSGTFAGRELLLDKALTTMGRPGVQVAAVTRRAEGFYIVHVESGKPNDFPVVNGQPTGPQAVKLTDNDVIELAGVKMGFFSI